ncbi:hypothetical protein C5167_004031 [Papaver somniferum]|nr:hypothetical protein C5167_004031 [Papaver somniferum]
MHHRQTTSSLEEQEGSGGVEPTHQDCIVCLERLRKGESCRSLPRCNHVFHANCVDTWLIHVPSCPLCRQIVVKLEN